MSLAIALGMGVGTIGALVVEGPFVTRYVVVDLRPPEPSPSTAPELFPELPLQPNIPPRRDSGTTGAAPPPDTTRARVATGRGAASVREAWLRARRRGGNERGDEGRDSGDGRSRRARPGTGVPGSPA